MHHTCDTRFCFFSARTRSALFVTTTTTTTTCVPACHVRLNKLLDYDDDDDDALDDDDDDDALAYNASAHNFFSLTLFLM